MGIQQHAVQRMIFQSLDNARLGINIIHTKKNVFALTVADNTLHMYGACMVPMREGGGRQPRDFDRHIVESVLTIYKSMAARCQTLVLCDDGCTNFKPSVRGSRDAMPSSEAVRYMKANAAHLRQVLFDHLDRLDICYVHIVGRDQSGRQGNIVTSESAPHRELFLAEFARDMRSAESDTLMFELVVHLRHRGYADSVAIISKDSDIVPTAMALVEDGVDLGDTTLGFANTMLCHRTANCKDMDQALDTYGWSCRLHAPAPAAEPHQIFEAVDEHTWTVMYDCDEPRLHFGPQMERVRELILRGTLSEPALCDFFGVAHREGVRGPLFRKIVHWMTDDLESAIARALADLVVTVRATGGRDLLAHLRQLLERHVEGADDDAFGPPRISHVPIMLRCAKRYAAGELYQGLYGHYLRSLWPTRYIIFMTVHRTPLTHSCVVLAALSGTDYNVSLARLGGSKLTAALGDPAVARACQPLRPGNLRARAQMPAILSALDIGYRRQGDLPAIGRYLDCMWRNVVYTLGVWTLRFPPADRAHGFEGGHFTDIPPKEVTNKYFSTANAAIRFAPPEQTQHQRPQ